MRDPFYASLAWRMLRSTYAQEHPLCEECLRRGISSPVEIVDHILPRKTHPQLSLVAVNLMSMCRNCHKRKTDSDYGKQTSAPKTGCDAQGNPLGKAGDEWRKAEVVKACEEDTAWDERKLGADEAFVVVGEMNGGMANETAPGMACGGGSDGNVSASLELSRTTRTRDAL